MCGCRSNSDMFRMCQNYSHAYPNLIIIFACILIKSTPTRFRCRSTVESTLPGRNSFHKKWWKMKAFFFPFWLTTFVFPFVVVYNFCVECGSERSLLFFRCTICFLLLFLMTLQTLYIKYMRHQIALPRATLGLFIAIHFHDLFRCDARCVEVSLIPQLKQKKFLLIVN